MHETCMRRRRGQEAEEGSKFKAFAPDQVRGSDSLDGRVVVRSGLI